VRLLPSVVFFLATEGEGAAALGQSGRARRGGSPVAAGEREGSAGDLTPLPTAAEEAQRGPTAVRSGRRASAE